MSVMARQCWHSTSRTLCCCHHNQHSVSEENGKSAITVDNAVANNALYYVDDFNDMSYAFSAGTSDDDGIWLNRNDAAGTVMSCLVWFLIGYSAVTMTVLAQTGGIPVSANMTYAVLACLALACHVKTTLTDPGSVPASAVPTHQQRLNPSTTKLSMCSQCQTFKPPGSHHCRICNRCISKMDHHCPWMNNCVGAGNLKHFLLFLIYTWTCAVLSLCVLGYNYFFCTSEACMFNVVLTQCVRVMTVLSVGAFLFTSSMLMNVVYGIVTGIGTIDRLKKKATGTMSDSEEDSIPLRHIFGLAPFYTWPLPVDPIFPDYDVVMGYSTPQRLLREQMKEGSGGYGYSYNGPHSNPLQQQQQANYYGNPQHVPGQYYDHPPQHAMQAGQSGGMSVMSKDSYSYNSYS
jgi:palmitoyltransferase ZDHHC3/7/25